MAKCAAFGCKNTNKTDNCSLFRFPKEKQRCAKWIENSGRHDLRQRSIDSIYSYCRICSDHFEQSQVLCTGRLVWNAVPTKFGPPNPPKPILLKRTVIPVPVENTNRNDHTPDVRRAEVEHSYARHTSIGHSSKKKPDSVAPVQVTGNIHRNATETVTELSIDCTQEVVEVNANYKTNMAFHNYAKYETDVESYSNNSTNRSGHYTCTQVRDKSTQKGVNLNKGKKKSDAAKRVELYRLRRKVKTLQARLDSINQNSLSTTDKIIASAKDYLNETSLQFFASQLRMSNREANGRRYTNEDMKLAFGLYKQNTTAYRFCKKIFTLPNRDSVKRWVQKMNAESDPNTPLLELPKRKPKKKTAPKKLKRKSGSNKTPSGVLQENGTTKPQRKGCCKKKKQQPTSNTIPSCDPSNDIPPCNPSNDILLCNPSNNASNSNTTFPVVFMRNDLTESETSVLCLSTFNGMML